MDNVIERRNKVYSCYKQIEEWVKKNAEGLFDKEEEFSVSSTECGHCEWSFFIKSNGDCYLCLNRTNYSIRDNVTSRGIQGKEYGWSEEKGSWLFDNHEIPYGFRGMEGVVFQWKNIKGAIEYRINRMKTLDEFEV